MKRNPDALRQATLSGLYAITDTQIGDSKILLAQVEAALDAGLYLLQYRDKSDDQTKRLKEATAIRQLCDKKNAIFLINDDIELAKQVNADGVHLGKADASIAEAREQLGSEAIVGVSCYNLFELAEKAQNRGASYVAFGSFYPSITKPDAVLATPELLKRWQEQSIPACAIGGITRQNAAALIDHGADMIALISSLWDNGNIQSNTKFYQSIFKP